jgi:radical SAM superfamily enzyme YgiQ (UPF0313 family)
MMMRVSLLKPPSSGSLGLDMMTFAEPLGLECIAGGLEADGHVCQVLDLRIDGLEKGLARVHGFGPQLIGVQCNFTTERYQALGLVRRAGEIVPDATLVVGGHDASRDPEWFVSSGVDVVAVGDGEENVPALAAALEAGRELDEVPGLVLRAGAGPKSTGAAPARKDIDGLPLPSRKLVREYVANYYTSFCRPLALLETARGCPFRCNFCSVWKFHGGSYREKSPRRVVQELREIDAPNVFVTDDIFWLNAERDREIARLISAEGIKRHFFVQTRTDIVTRGPEIIEAWKACGKLTVFLGLESVCDEGLTVINKRNSAANNDRAIEILKDLGVGYAPNFIVDPDWDREDFSRLRRWIDRTGAYNSGFSVLTPLPGTDLWDALGSKVTTTDWELYDLEHAVLPTRLPLEEFYREYAGLWRHTLDVRYRERGWARSQLRLVLGLATGRITLAALRRGLRIGKALSRPAEFLKGHRERPSQSREVTGVVE